MGARARIGTLVAAFALLGAHGCCAGTSEDLLLCVSRERRLAAPLSTVEAPSRAHVAAFIDAANSLGDIRAVGSSRDGRAVWILVHSGRAHDDYATYIWTDWRKPAARVGPIRSTSWVDQRGPRHIGIDGTLIDFTTHQRWPVANPRALAVSSSNTIATTHDENNEVRIDRLGQGGAIEPVATIRVPGPVHDAGWTSDGEHLVITHGPAPQPPVVVNASGQPADLGVTNLHCSFTTGRALPEPESPSGDWVLYYEIGSWWNPIDARPFPRVRAAPGRAPEGRRPVVIADEGQSAAWIHVAMPTDPARDVD